MSLLGKIFVGMIAAMSVILFALSLVIVSKHEDWRKDAIAYQQQIDSVIKENQLIAENNKVLNEQLAAQRKSQQAASETLTRQTEELIEKNNTLRTTFRDFEIELQQQIESIFTNNTTIKESRQLIQSLQGEVAESQKFRGAYLRDLARSVTLKYEQSSLFDRFEFANKDLLSRYENAKAVLNKFGLKDDPSAYIKRPRYPVEGLIEFVPTNRSGNLLISIGSSDGLEPGHLLDVYRGSMYLGRVRVLTTEPNRAVCRTLLEYRQGYFQIGDIVTSKFL